VAIFSSHDGSLNEGMYRRIDTVIDLMTVAGFDCRRIVHDGDRFLLGRASEFLERAFSILPRTLTNPFDFIACMSGCDRGDFFNMLHLLKNDRAQKVGITRFLFLWAGSPVVTPDVDKAIRSIPRGVFNQSASVKMDDH
jgi:hypothetical protein